MPIHAPPDTVLALRPGFAGCDSRSLFKDKFNLFDAAFPEDKQVSLDLYLAGGRNDLNSLRNAWQATKEKQEQNRAQGRNVNERELHKATAALDATKKFDLVAPLPILRDRSWLKSLPAGRVRTFKLRTASRLLVGLANGTLENAGCTLHPRLGFPIIPGSALKGIAQDAAAYVNLPAAETKQIFGATPEDSSGARQGDVCFLDAFAVLKRGEIDMEMDVLTPHYQNYYNRTGNPDALDEESPIPSVFPAVCQGITFEFVLAATTLRCSPDRAKLLLEESERCLRHALIHFGIGSKTAAGYGYFREPEAAHFVPASDLFPLPPKLVLTPEQEFVAKWKGNAGNTFRLRALISDLQKVEIPAMLAAIFNEVIPPEHLANFRSANPYWTAFLQNGGKTIFEKLNLTLPRQ